MSLDQAQAEMSVTDLDDLGARIPFGPRPNQTMPASWAASILTMLAERQPALFGGLMLEATTGYRATVKAAK